MIKLKANCCDGKYNSYDIHFTSLCDNKCKHCIDACYEGKNIPKPNPKEIAKTIINGPKELEDVLFLGGEPCLFLDELIETMELIRQARPEIKLYITSSVPKTCYDNKEKFFKILDMVDGFNISAQHYNEEIADKIRCTTSKYNRQEFYNSLPHKEKIRINLNIVKPFLYTKEDLIKCLSHYDKMGFNSIKLSEIQHGKEFFVSFEKTMGIKLKSPFAHGCQTYIDMEKIIPGFKTPLLLKRSCFLCEESLKASFADLIKSIVRPVDPKNVYGVIYEDGKLEKGWI